MKEKYKAVIIDDEPYSIDVLRMLLQSECADVIRIAGTTTESTQGIQLLNTLQPDVVFLDIEMPRLNGFQLLDGVQNLYFHLIFTTAYDKYAVKAFRYSALDYLMKPINAKELKEAIARLPDRQRLNREHLKLTEKNLQSLTAQGAPEQIILPHAKGYLFQKLDSIIYCEAMGAYTKFFIENKPAFVTSKALSEIEELLNESHFFRIHRQYIINIKKVQEMLREDGGMLLMSNGAKIPVARNRKEEFMTLIRR